MTSSLFTTYQLFDLFTGFLSISLIIVYLLQTGTYLNLLCCDACNGRLLSSCTEGYFCVVIKPVIVERSQVVLNDNLAAYRLLRVPDCLLSTCQYVNNSNYWYKVNICCIQKALCLMYGSSNSPTLKIFEFEFVLLYPTQKSASLCLVPLLANLLVSLCLIPSQSHSVCFLSFFFSPSLICSFPLPTSSPIACAHFFHSLWGNKALFSVYHCLSMYMRKRVCVQWRENYKWIL